MESMPEKRLSRFAGLMLPLALLGSACEQHSSDQSPAAELAVTQPCDVRTGCVAQTDGFSITLSMGPQVQPLKPFVVKVERQRGASIDSITADFDMADMDMGSNRYGLIEDAGTWQANVTLPMCMSGRSDWIADFEVFAAGQRYQLEVPFVLEK